MWCAVWFSFPQMHEAVSLSTHWHMLGPKRPTLVLSQFEVAKRLRGRFGARGKADVWAHAKLGRRCNVFPWAHRCSFDLYRGWQRGCGNSASTSVPVSGGSLQVCDGPQRRCWLLNAACQTSLHVSCYLRRFGDTMPTRISNSPIGVGRKQPSNTAQRVIYCNTQLFCCESCDIKLGQHIPSR